MLPVIYLEDNYSSTCGYCYGQPGERSILASSIKYGISPMTPMPCSLYMDMIDRGWRRSGKYMYKPDMKRTCCPQYTIRLDACDFSVTRSLRQIAYRWNRFITEGDKEGSVDIKQPKSKLSGKSMPPFDLVQSVHAAESGHIDDSIIPAHRFEVTLEPATFSDEKFNLYQQYQQIVHNDDDQKPSDFESFSVKTTLSDTDIIPYSKPDPPSHLPRKYGSYHQCYRLDGELFAIGVLDILPGCVSSVYFMHDTKWDKYSPGRLSALREVALAKEMKEAGLDSMHSLYMGYYVYTSTKMRYKADYSPSFLLDPEDYTWHPLKECNELLSQHRYVCFARPETSLDADPGPEDPPEYSEDELKDLSIFDQSLRAPVSLTMSDQWKNEKSRHVILRGIQNLGLSVARRFVLLVE